MKHLIPNLFAGRWPVLKERMDYQETLNSLKVLGVIQYISGEKFIGPDGIEIHKYLKEDSGLRNVSNGYGLDLKMLLKTLDEHDQEPDKDGYSMCEVTGFGGLSKYKVYFHMSSKGYLVDYGGDGRRTPDEILEFSFDVMKSA